MDERPVCAVSWLLLSLISSHDESATAATAAAPNHSHELFASKFNDWTRGANGVKLNSKPPGRGGSYIVDALDRTAVERAKEGPQSLAGTHCPSAAECVRSSPE